MARLITVKDVTNQFQLEDVINTLFLGENTLTNTRKDSSIKNPSTGSYLEIDLWLPKIGVCFEFQDIYHYTSAWYSHAPLTNIQLQDSTKRAAMLQRGETLILVPCWWDGSKESLTATIRMHRPDLLQYAPSADPIPLNPPVEYFETLDGSIPNVGKLMLASFIPSINATLATKPIWWLGEKYDGLRFCWHPKNRELYTRTGVTVDVPQPFTKLFPRTLIDGEIWFGRGLFQECQRMIKSPFESILWHLLRIIAFDQPVSYLSTSDPFETRYRNLLQTSPPAHPFIIVVMRMMCTTKIFLKQVAKMVMDNGGEGAILRAASSLYEHGRSPNLVKVKAARGDQEGIVTHVSKDGSVSLKLPSGITIAIPAVNVKVLAKPKRGDVVTITYDTVSRYTIPVNPIIRRIRVDVSWGEILRRHAEEVPKELVFTDVSKKALNTTPDKESYWASNKGRTMRLFFENFAKDRNFDPLVAENWYGVTSSDIVAAKGKFILRYFGWGLIKCLVHLFPDVKFDVTKFSSSPKKFWKSVGNRKKFFLSFAKEHGFDPLVPENWYNVKKKEINNHKGASAMFQPYQGSYVKALIHLFPDIPFIRSKFSQGNYWLDAKNRREVLENFARRGNFDPYVAENWYSALPVIHGSKDAKTVLSMLEYYNGSLAKALSQLFPDVQFDETKFIHFRRPQWHSQETHRLKYFTDFAESKKFDPLVAENWYSVSQSDLFAFKGTNAAQLVAAYYDGSLVTALLFLFPNIGLKRNRFTLLPIEKRTFWSDKNRRRQMLLDFAKHHKFDPFEANNWPPYTKADLFEFKGHKDVNSMLVYHSSSFVKALTQLLPEAKIADVDFITYPRNYWDEEKNRRRFFETYAKEAGFNPLVPENWYSVFVQNLISRRGASSILGVYGTFKRGLISLFPEIGLEPRKFQRLT